jgi:hypothetical protein
MTDRLDEIRRLMREATPGPWRWGDSQYRELRLLGADGGLVLTVNDCSSYTKQIIDIEAQTEPDADLIAAAPELLAWAAGEIERLRGVNDGVRDWAQGRVDVLSRCIDGNRVDLTTRTEMMYERTIMRDLVAMLDEGET